MATINIRDSIKSLINFTPALTNLWEFQFEQGGNSGLDSGAQQILQNLEYCISSIDIEGWSFKYDFIPAYQRNVLTGVNRPTKITITLTDIKKLGFLDSFIDLIKNRLYVQKNSTHKTGASGRILGDFIIKIIDPYYKNASEGAYFPLADDVTPERFVSFLVTCENIYLGSTPVINLTRTESKPLSYIFEFYCDYINYVSNISDGVAQIVPLEELEAERKREPVVNFPRTDTQGLGVPVTPFSISEKFKKFLEITTPVFTNMFLVDFNFGDTHADLITLNNLHRSKNSIFNDMLIESVVIDGYTLDYTYSEAVSQNIPSKIKRPMNITFTIIDNRNLSFLTALHTIIKRFYYCNFNDCFIKGYHGKNMEAIFVLYSKTSEKTAELEYLIYAEGMKIAKMPAISLNYTNSEVLRFTIEMVCDNITYFNKNEIAGNTVLNTRTF